MSVEQSITIVLGSCKNLRLTRGDAFTIFAQVTLGKTQLGESSRIECKIEENNCVLDLEVKYSLKVAEPLSFDEITKYPLLISIYEVLPKDKKSKEEKTQLIGIANVDLLPLLQGHTKIEKNLKLNPLSAVSPPEDTPEIDVTISTMSSLLTPGDMEKSNILSLRVNGMYSLPEVLLTGQGSTFTIATPRPHIDSAPLNITGGELKNAGDVDLPQKIGHWRWSELPLSTTGIAALTNTSLDVNAVEDESGQLCTTQEDIDFRRAAESRKQRVIWNSELRAYLPPAHNSSFLNHLSHMPIWPIEVLRITPTVGKGKGKEEEPALSHHGMALVNMSSLLYPGNTKIFGAYCVEGMNEMELASKTNDGHVKSIMDQVHKSTGGIPGSIKKAAISAKRPSTAMRASLASIVSEAPNTAEVNKDVYVDSKTYILLEIELAHPLIPKRPASVISEKILEYIPPRPAIPRRLGGAEKAISDFHSATTDVVSLLLTDYKSLFGDALAENGELPNTDKDFEDRKRQLLYSLNTSGRYHAYKEHMKKSVVSLVREKFLNEANTKSDEEKQAFLSRLYAYLVDEMHIALGKIFSLEDSAPPPPTIIDCDMMMQFAHETELLLDLDTAEYYHKELLAKEEHIALHWYDYGVFHLLKGDTEHSEQCLKEAIALDQQFVPALLLYGMCCSLEEKFAEANEVMELATTIDPNNIIAWTIRGFYCT
jgi:tetratricopeptide (TPR) repeat protein